MQFKQKKAAATFQTLMKEILQELLDNGGVVYVDDILIYSRTWTEHIILV